MHKLRRFFEGTRTHFGYLSQYLFLTPLLVTNIIEAVDHHEDVSFLMRSLPNKFFGRQCEMVGC